MSADALYKRCTALIHDIRNTLCRPDSSPPDGLAEACREVSSLLSPYSPYGPAIGPVSYTHLFCVSMGL